ncbi:hypothetical protein N0V83_008337 [Neocucurbitaria cava]|uniref:Uncharacterized protein n=1 Tax=Neocucurbitaria cava TaxID=798079 RepID=A0A9W8Y3C5_9PLEO|nr:hypothetical protein N0V83_008337 [Neocucurbitaria cava]
MAPNGHAAAGRNEAHQSRSSSLRNWLDQYGDAEFRTWQDEHPTHDLTYDDWKHSEHVDGLSLYYATLSLFEEPDSSDEEAEKVEVKPRARAVRGQTARESKKKVTMNGNGPSRATGSATPSTLPKPEDLSSPGKRKRRARKKYLSEEIVASDGDSELEELGASTPIAEAAKPVAPVNTVDGRRKSSSVRKASRKKILSDEIISPEDEIDDPVTIDEVATPAIVSPLPVRSAPKTSTPAQSVEAPKKTILKLSTRRAPKKILSDALVVDEDASDARTPAPALTVKKTAKPSANASTGDTVDGDSGIESKAVATKASSKVTDASAASTRRGLRTRRPAQKRPYFHDALDAQLFDDIEPEGSDATDLSPNARSRRASVASLSKDQDESLLEELHDESIAVLQDDPELGSSERRPKHFKGKGRAWKKEESDEDEEFTIAKRKAAKAAKAKAKGQAPTQKKRGRPRKSVLSEDLVRDESDSDAVEKEASVKESKSPVRAGREPLKKAKATPRKSVLSEEIIREDSESAAEDKPNIESTDSVPALEVPTVEPKKRGRPRKSDQSTTSKSSDHRHEEEEVHPHGESHTPQETPKSKRTPENPEAPLSSVQGTETKESNSHMEVTEPAKDNELAAARTSGEQSVNGDEEPRE